MWGVKWLVSVGNGPRAGVHTIHTQLGQKTRLCKLLLGRKGRWARKFLDFPMWLLWRKALRPPRATVRWPSIVRRWMRQLHGKRHCSTCWASFAYRMTKAACDGRHVYLHLCCARLLPWVGRQRQPPSVIRTQAVQRSLSRVRVRAAFTRLDVYAKFRARHPACRTTFRVSPMPVARIARAGTSIRSSRHWVLAGSTVGVSGGPCVNCIQAKNES